MSVNSTSVSLYMRFLAGDLPIYCQWDPSTETFKFSVVSFGTLFWFSRTHSIMFTLVRGVVGRQPHSNQNTAMQNTPVSRLKTSVYPKTRKLRARNRT